MFKLDQTCPKWMKFVKIGSKLDQIGSNVFKIDQNLFKLFKIKMSRSLDWKVLFSLFWREKLTSTRGPITYLFQLLVKSLHRVSIVSTARLAQSVEHETLNLRVVGSSPTLGEHFCMSNLWQQSGNVTCSQSCKICRTKWVR